MCSFYRSVSPGNATGPLGRSASPAGGPATSPASSPMRKKVARNYTQISTPDETKNRRFRGSGLRIVNSGVGGAY